MSSPLEICDRDDRTPEAAVRVAEAAERAGFVVRFIDGVVPIIPAETVEGIEGARAVFEWVASGAVGGCRVFAEGFVLEPPKPKPRVPQWPETEPEVMARYGWIEEGSGTA